MAISYNLGVTVFGGFAPLTVTWLIAITGNKLMPAFYIIAAAMLSIVVVGSTLRGGAPARRDESSASMKCIISVLFDLFPRGREAISTSS